MFAPLLRCREHEARGARRHHFVEIIGRENTGVL
jgi:hypothetical protein